MKCTICGGNLDKNKMSNHKPKLRQKIADILTEEDRVEDQIDRLAKLFKLHTYNYELIP